METPIWRRPPAFLILLGLAATGAGAKANELERVRTDSPYLQAVLASGAEGSPTFRALLDRLEQSDLIVEIRCGLLRESILGRTALLSATPSVRYVLVEIGCPMTFASALRIVAHELRHAVEIASAPSVVDARSLGRLYSRIGFLACGGIGCEEYETTTALDAGERVCREMRQADESARRVIRINQVRKR